MKLDELLLHRKELLKINETSIDSQDDLNLDANAEEIKQFLFHNYRDLPVEVSLQAITMIGAAPSLLYDDNGHWTVGSEGSQSMPTILEGWEDKDCTFHASWFVAKGKWKNTIREALNDYFEEMGKE